VPEPVRDHPRRWEVEAPPLEEHDPAAWMIAKVPLGERARWRDRLRRERAQGELRLLRRAASLNVVRDDAAAAPPLLLPDLSPIQVAAVPVLDVVLATAGRVLLLPSLERGRALPRAAA
jgi:hypothetical protein